MRIRIYWKLTLVFCAINLIVLTGIYLYLNHNLKSYVESRINDDLKRSLLFNKDILDRRLSRMEPADIEHITRSIGDRLGVRATIIDQSGKVTGDSEVTKEDLDKLENHSARPEVQDALKNGIGVSKRFSTSIRKDMLYMAVPLGTGKALGVLRLAIPLADVEAIEGRIFRMIAVAMIFAFIITMLGSFIISVMISRPLHEMSDVAGRLAKGDFSRKALAYSNDEIGDLAKAVNNMATEIESEISDISKEKAKLEAVLSSMFEGVMLTDAKGSVILMNPSLKKLFFIDSDPDGKRPLKVLRNNAVQDMVDEVVSGKAAPLTREISMTFPEARTVIINGVPIYKEGAAQGAVFVFHDITELKRLEDIRKEFVANVSHELRTPISSIKGYAETLIDGKVQDAGTVKEFLGIIHQNSERLANLINDLLDLAGIESGKMKMDLSASEARPVIDKCLNILDKAIKDKSIKIKMDVPADLPKILVDHKRISQVFLNLLDNAVKYTPEGGAIAVTADTLPKAVKFNITDTGIGIPEKDLPRIFERFYRVDKARSRELGGTGLGLSIVKHIVQAHGGDVWVQSVPDRGSTFSFTVPKA